MSSVASGRTEAALMPTPTAHGFQAWNADITFTAGNATPTAATIYLAKIMIPRTISYTKLAVQLVVTGTGAVALSNGQTGVYSSAGTLISSCAAADTAAGGATPWDEAALGTSLTTQVAESGQTMTLSGSPTAFVWAAVHVGTQASTACQFRGWPAAGGLTSAISNANLTAATARFGTYTGHASNNLTTIGALTPASITLSALGIWVALL